MERPLRATNKHQQHINEQAIFRGHCPALTACTLHACTPHPAPAPALLTAAAGLFSYGVHELQELEMFGTWDPSEERNHMVSGVVSVEFACGICARHA